MEGAHGGSGGSPDSPAKLRPIPKDKLKKRHLGDESSVSGTLPSRLSSPDKRRADSEAIINLLAQQETSMESLVRASKALEDENTQFKRVIMHREYEQQLLALQSEVRQSTQLMRAQNEELLARLRDKDAQLAEERAARAALEGAGEADRREREALAAAKENVEHHRDFLRGELDRAHAATEALRAERDALAGDGAEHARLAAEGEALRRDLGEAESEGRALRAQVRELKEGGERDAKVAEARVRALEGELEALRGAGDKAHGLEGRLREALGEAAARGERVANLEAVTEGLSREARGLRAQIGPLQDSLGAARADLDERTREMAAQRARADAAEDALAGVRGERDALFASLAAALRHNEEEKEAATRREASLRETTEAAQAEAAENAKRLQATVTKLEAELVYRDEGNSALQKTIESLRTPPPTIEAGAEGEGAGSDRLAQLQDENQLLQRLTGLQEAMSRLNASQEWGRDEDGDTTIAERRSFTDLDFVHTGHSEGSGLHALNYSVTSDRSTVLQDQGELDSQRQWSGATESRLSTASVKSAERAGLLSATSGLRWESWSPDFDLSMASYYTRGHHSHRPSTVLNASPHRPQEPQPTPVFLPAPVPQPEPAPQPAPVVRPPPPEPEPPLNSSNHPGTYLTPGVPFKGR